MVTRFGLRTTDGRLTVAPDELTAYAWLDYDFGEKYTIGSVNERLVADDGTGWKFVKQEDLDEYHNR